MLKNFGLEEDSEGEEFMELAQKIVQRALSEATYISAAKEVGE